MKREAIRQEQQVVLTTVISRKGSLPMSTRAKMLVFQNGSIQGTLGGGILEADVIQKARQILEHRQPSQVVGFELTSVQIDADGLTCGGTVEILIEPIFSGMDMAVFRKLEQVYLASKRAVIATLLPDEGRSLETGETERYSEKIHKLLLDENGIVTGTFGDDAVDAQIIEMARSRLDRDILETVELDSAGAQASLPTNQRIRVFFDSISPSPTAYIFGGGHVSLALSKILRFIGFEYVVIDDRQEFVTSERFPDAQQRVCQDFDTALGTLDVSVHSAYIIIITRGHQADRIVLEQALRYPVKYIGMIGSRRKVKLLLNDLRQQGFSQECLEQIHAPIGLEIEADTPEEIAISIAAELIKVRRSSV
ncbi:hypothetical protein CSA56_16160 [candidate division KSB3 bacterium]|uniref:Dehydrogenase n=1 Tax=candidate division KSB3 bacterium TaxID=2044937 RepID=A0A2G6K905_9BACT|nr:MAG: hypothetical protein CSA56_16160 [candidate division KSB3 bacterium]